MKKKQSPPLTANSARLSIYVLESSNSRRLTYFMPPLVSERPNLLGKSVKRLMERLFYVLEYLAS
jgi:hypothetical protein